MSREAALLGTGSAAGTRRRHAARREMSDGFGILQQLADLFTDLLSFTVRHERSDHNQRVGLGWYTLRRPCAAGVGIQFDGWGSSEETLPCLADVDADDRGIERDHKVREGVRERRHKDAGLHTGDALDHVGD